MSVDCILGDRVGHCMGRNPVFWAINSSVRQLYRLRIFSSQLQILYFLKYVHHSVIFLFGVSIFDAVACWLKLPIDNGPRVRIPPEARRQFLGLDVTMCCCLWILPVMSEDNAMAQLLPLLLPWSDSVRLSALCWPSSPPLGCRPLTITT